MIRANALQVSSTGISKSLQKNLNSWNHANENDCECVALRTSDNLTAPLREEPILNLGEFHGRGAGFVVVRHV
jgi:hypothetical protein